MEEIAVDPDAPYYGLSKEEFERIAFWRKLPRCPELDRAGDWLLANLGRIRAETIEPIDGSPMRHVPYDGKPS